MSSVSKESAFERSYKHLIDRAKRQKRMKKVQRIQEMMDEYKMKVRRYPAVKQDYCRMNSINDSLIRNQSSIIKFIELQINEYKRILALEDRILRNNSEIESLLRTIPSEALSVSCIFSYSDRFEYENQVSYNFTSNFLIVSKIISLLTDKELDVDTFMNTMRETLKRINELHKENDDIRREIDKSGIRINKTIPVDDDMLSNLYDKLLFFLRLPEKFFVNKDDLIKEYYQLLRFSYDFSNQSQKIFSIIMNLMYQKRNVFHSKYEDLLSEIKEINPEFAS